MDVLVAYGRTHEEREKGADNNVSILGKFVVKEFTEKNETVNFARLHFPFFCFLNSSHCRSEKLYSGSSVFLYGCSKDEEGGEIRIGDYIDLLVIIGDQNLPKGNIALEKKYIEKHGLEIGQIIILKSCDRLKNSLHGAATIFLKFECADKFIESGRVVSNITGLKTYLAEELMERHRYVKRGQNINIRYLGASYRATIIKIIAEEEIDVMNEAHAKEPFITHNTEMFYRVTSTTRINVVFDSIFNIENREKLLFVTDELYEMKNQFNILHEICKVKFFSDVPQKQILEKADLKMPHGVLVIGPKGCGKTLLCWSVAKSLKIKTLIITPDDFELYKDPNEYLFASSFEALSLVNPSILIIKDIDLICGINSIDSGSKDTNTQDLTTKLISLLDSQKLTNSLVLATLSRIEQLDPKLRRPLRFDYEVEVAMPSSKTLGNVLKSLIKKDAYNGIDEEQLCDIIKTAMHGYTGLDAISVYKKAVELSRENDEQFTALHIKSALKFVKPLSMLGISLEIPEVSWNSIGGQDHVKQKLKEAVEFPIKYRDIFEKYNITQIKGILLYGPPGCSKTLMAKALATESNFSFLAVKGPEVFSKWVGESEKAVREIFRRARAAAPSIIFFDEIDSIVSKRSDNNKETSVGDRVLSQLLTEMDGIESMYDVVIIAATNRPDLIDPAILRPGRIDRMLYVGPPDYNARVHIFKLRFSTCKCAIEISPEKLAELTEGYSGAECVHIVQEACMIALEESEEINTLILSYFEEALKRVKPQISPEIINFYNKFKQDSKIEQI